MKACLRGFGRLSDWARTVPVLCDMNPVEATFLFFSTITAAILEDVFFCRFIKFIKHTCISRFFFYSDFDIQCSKPKLFALNFSCQNCLKWTKKKLLFSLYKLLQSAPECNELACESKGDVNTFSLTLGLEINNTQVFMT